MVLSIWLDSIFCSESRKHLNPLSYLWCHSDDIYLLLLTKRVMSTFTTITVF